MGCPSPSANVAFLRHVDPHIHVAQSRSARGLKCRVGNKEGVTMHCCSGCVEGGKEKVG